MKIKRNTNNDKDFIEVGNLVLCVVDKLSVHGGMIGESYIHYAIWEMLNHPAFKGSPLRNKVKFELNENRPYSWTVHNAIRVMSKDMFKHKTMENDNKQTYALMASPVIENREEIMNAEQWLYDTFKDGSEPTMFTLTIPGELAVAVTWNQL